MALHNWWHAALDLLFPGSARAQRVRTLTTAQLTLDPVTQATAHGRITSLMPYSDASVRDCIWALKYERSEPAAQLLADVLADWLLATIADDALVATRPLLIVPLPLAPRRQRARGYNQTELIVRQLPPDVTYHIRTDILTRTRETQPQTKLARAERLRNVADAFAVSPAIDLRNTRILLIDDVTTTGATLTHAAGALERAGASVESLALARAA